MEKNKELRVFAEEIRVETLKELANLGFGHIGGSMSVVELLAVLYGREMRIDPQNPQWEDRDKLVMSKGHAGPAVYATLALKGYFPREELLTLNQGGTNLPSHCDRNKTIGIDMTIKQCDWNVFLQERKNGNFDFAREGWIADFNDPINMLEMWITESGNNDCQFGR